MTSDRPHAIKTCAKLLLEKLWKRRAEFFAGAVKTDEFLRASPEILVKQVLELHLEYRDLRSSDPRLQIAGFMDREERLIVIAHGLRREIRRFTLAHEIGHWMLHTGQRHFRERQIPGNDVHYMRRPKIEVEADLFAAALLMPEKALRDSFAVRFGGPIDGRIVNPELAHDISVSASKTIDARTLSIMDPAQRATWIAKAGYFNGRFFKALIEEFDVSPTAMGIQLLETGLVH